MINMEEFASLIKPYVKDVRWIVEAGASDSIDGSRLLNEFPEAQGVFIEPRDVGAAIPISPRAKFFRVALSDERGKFKFYLSKNNPEASSLYPRLDEECEEIEVEAVRLDELLSKNNMGMDILKVDVEGAALKVLRGAGEYLDKTQAIHLETEVSEFWKGAPLQDAVYGFLLSRGFDRPIDRFRAGQSDSVWIHL